MPMAGAHLTCAALLEPAQQATRKMPLMFMQCGFGQRGSVSMSETDLARGRDADSSRLSARARAPRRRRATHSPLDFRVSAEYRSGRCTVPFHLALPLCFNRPPFLPHCSTRSDSRRAPNSSPRFSMATVRCTSLPAQAQVRRACCSGAWST